MRPQSIGFFVTTGTLVGVLAAASLGGPPLSGPPPGRRLPPPGSLAPGNPPVNPPNVGAQDPGVRGGAAGAGDTYPILDSANSARDAADKTYFAAAKIRFAEIDSVSGTIPGELGTGLGPRFNANSCAQCHAFPAPGGSSPLVNPQVAGDFAHLDGALNPVDLSGILSLNGPVREVRQIIDPATGLSDGSVADLFTIQGRSDAPGATVAQVNFPLQLANHNLSFRIPTPLFGLGLVEMTSDANLRANLDGTATQRAALGIGGRFNYNGNTQTITRFGWKAQNQSLLMFAGEAYSVEQGVSNELFDNERFTVGEDAATVASSTFNGVSEDSTNTLLGDVPTGTASDLSSDIVNFAAFGRLLAPATPTTTTASQLAGSHLFTQIGCQDCHSPSLTTSKAAFPALSNVTYHPYSDFAIHHMGTGLADGVSQGEAGPDEFRTAPLWGVGQRAFFLHDGRTNDIVQAIEAHAGSGSEANAVIRNFHQLSPGQQQDVVNFLRSL